jgi:hypothetical protein
MGIYDLSSFLIALRFFQNYSLEIKTLSALACRRQFNLLQQFKQLKLDTLTKANLEFN